MNINNIIGEDNFEYLMKNLILLPNKNTPNADFVNILASIKSNEFRHFKIKDNSLSNLLFNTKNNIEIKKLPFNHFFINVNLTIENFLIKGILISDYYNMNLNMVKKGVITTNYFENLNMIYENEVEIIYFLFDKDKLEQNFISGKLFIKDEKMTIDTIFGYKNDKELQIHKKKVYKICMETKTYVMNFLDLINNPDEINIDYIIKDEKTNEKREKKGLYPLPSKIIITPKEELKQYIYNTNEQKWKHSYRYLVRGHWKHWRNHRYKELKNTKTWIKPFWKGKGLKKTIKYEVENG